MKRAVFALLVFISFGISATSAFAQDGYKVSAVSFGAGDTPISGGVSAAVDFTNEKGGFVEVMAQSEQAWFMMGKNWKKGGTKCSLYGSVGHFQGAPWVGPYAGCSRLIGKVGGQEVSVGALTWPGVYIGREPKNWRTENDGVKNPEALPAGFFSIASVSVGGVSLSMAYLNFLDDPVNYLPGVSYTRAVRPDFEANGSVTWNVNTRAPMFFVGGTWRPKK